jgi:hypothetical protein
MTFFFLAVFFAGVFLFRVEVVETLVKEDYEFVGFFLELLLYYN